MNISKIILSNEIIYTNKHLDFEITGIVSDSRNAHNGCAFVAIKGENRDGNDYINDAISKGAIIIVTEEKNANYEIPIIVVENIRSTYSKMLSRYYNYPTENMKVIAVTGTNGKTTTSHYLYNILKYANMKCGMISTIECLIMDKKEPVNGGGEVEDIYSAMTTPDPGNLYKLLYKMKKKGVEYLIIETSSHALKQRRLDGINVDIAIFTNLSPEHLDYHTTMEDYFITKSLLFEKAKEGIVNISDDYGKKLLSKYEHMHTVSFDSAGIGRIENIYFCEGTTKFIFNFRGESIELETILQGEYNAMNATLAAYAAKLLNVDNDAIKDGVKSTLVSGRLEQVYKNVYIDYAHTPLATENVLITLKKTLNGKKIIALFGCGGERDKTKRAEIGKIVSKYSDVAIITSDNSRNEDLFDIIKDIIVGINTSKPYFVIPDRKNAIIYAIKHLVNDDSVLILLGKGHENYQIDKTGKHHFDEKEIIKEGLLDV